MVPILYVLPGAVEKLPPSTISAFQELQAWLYTVSLFTTFDFLCYE
jgi:hypothetical protein